MENPARDIVRRFFDEAYPHRTKVKEQLSSIESAKALHDGDFLLSYLWSEGLKIVPVTMDDLTFKGTEK